MQTNNRTVLSARSLGYRYAEGGGFQDFSIDCVPGEVVALLGPNGSGKTTILKVLAGLLAPQEGEVRVKERNLSELSPRSRARHIAMVSQRNEIPFAFTVRECILMGRYALARPFRGPDESDEKKIEDLLQKWNLTALADRPVNLLSGGELQKVLVLRAMAQESSVILLDEPSNNLDPANQTMLASLIRSMANDGHAVMVVLHDLNLANSVADRSVLLRDGRVVIVGDSAEVFREDVLESAFGTTFLRLDHRGKRSAIVPRY